MSEFIFIIGWFGIITFLYNFLPTKEYLLVHGNEEYRTRLIFAVFIIVPLVYMVANRSLYIGDTYAYKVTFDNLPNSTKNLFEYVTQVNKDKGFTVLSGIIKIIFGNNYTTYFLILAIIQIIPLVYIYKTYSTSYAISMFLFIASTDYLSWMYNGLRQFTAVAIIFAATPLMIKKKWIPLILTILFASTIHGSALLMIPVVFIVQGRAWNKKTILFTLACVLALTFADQFTTILDTLLYDTQYTNVVSDWKNLNDDGTNIIRVLVYSIPALMAFFGRKWIDFDNDPCINLCTNMSIISAAIYLVSAGTSGVYIGRLPIYMSLYGYMLLPYLIDQIFTRESARFMKFIMIGAYLAFYYYQIHFTWGLI